ncbi:MAG: type II toxin-antitoxin system RelE/ParE family toxin [archaeon]|nr:type II toxin-antitoxin system RelE/ParE family toxin [archaeon]
MYNLEIRESIDLIFKKLYKKDKISFEYISKKINEARENPYHFKPLKNPLQNYRRIHIGNFVLIYSINEQSKTIIIEKYKHHDEAYKGS